MRIRRAKSTDLAAILVIEAASFRKQAWLASVFEWYLCAFPRLFLIAVQSGEPVGYVLGSVRSSLGEIDSVAVLPDRRRHHAGLVLMKAVIRALVVSGANRIGLMVRPDNTAAISLYRKLGFVRRRTVREYYENGAHAWRMTLQIDES